MERHDATEFEERVIKINRVAKVLKGGRKFGFNAIVIIGDHTGRIGLGFGKANEVPDSIRKAANSARKNIMQVPIVNDTIPFEATGRCERAKVLLKPAKPGTGIVAGSGVRAILEVSGIKNIVAKSLGSNASDNLCKATLDALNQISIIMKSIGLRNQKDSDEIEDDYQGVEGEKNKGKTSEKWNKPEEESEADS